MNIVMIQDLPRVIVTVVAVVVAEVVAIGTPSSQLVWTMLNLSCPAWAPVSGLSDPISVHDRRTQMLAQSAQVSCESLPSLHHLSPHTYPARPPQCAPGHNLTSFRKYAG